MTSIIKDLETVYMTPTDSGMEFSLPHDPQTVPVYLRVEIYAWSRDAWRISEVWMLEEESSYSRDGIMRASEVRVKLTGEFKDYAISFIKSQHAEFLQDAVDLEVLPSGESVGYEPLRASDVVECGRRM